MPGHLPELSVRERDVGGPVAGEVSPRTPAPPYGRRQVVLLVHGFNVSLKKGRDAYREFEANLHGLGPAGQRILSRVCRFFWPGDSKAKALSYPTELKPAEKSGEVLEQYLRGLRGPDGGPVEVFLIAHSLGNRLMLELLRKRLDGVPEPAVHIKRICLMAAAVPVKRAKPGERYGRAAQATRTRTLFSKKEQR